MVTNYQLNRRQRMNEYLDSLKEEAIRINGDESVIWLAKDFLTLFINKLAQQNKVLEVPDCCPSESNEGNFHIMFIWDKDEHYLECEIFNSGVIEFFYRNRDSGEDWGWDLNYSVVKPGFNNHSDELIDKLSLFVE